MPYKEYDFIEEEYNGYKGAIYKDNMFGMEFVNFSLFKDNEEIFHSTLTDGIKYTKETVICLIKQALTCLGKLEGCDD